MALLHRDHPTRPDWWTYKCDECGESFGNDAGFMPAPGVTMRCYHCAKPTHCHLVGNHHPGAFRSDLQFHGEHYKG